MEDQIDPELGKMIFFVEKFSIFYTIAATDN